MTTTTTTTTSKASTAEEKLNALRVAHAELCSGDTSGDVYLQPSPGAAMFLTSREIAVNHVTNEIRTILKADDNNNNSNKAKGSRSATTTTAAAS